MKKLWEFNAGEKGTFLCHKWDDLPPEAIPGSDGESGFSETVIVVDVANWMFTQAWYDYHMCKWQTDCPIDGFGEEEMNDQETEKSWISFEEESG